MGCYRSFGSSDLQLPCWPLWCTVLPTHRQADARPIPTPTSNIAATQVGGDALVVRPCTTCRTGVSTAAFNLGGYSTSAFSAPRSTAFTVAAAGTAEGGSAIWAQVRLKRWLVWGR